MNHYFENISPGTIAASDLSDWALAHGITALSTDDIAYLCGIPTNQVSPRMAALRKSSKLFSPARGLWIPIPPEYRTWGAPDPMIYIADTMQHLGADYLVGWLSAAERYGASHHAPQVFQVATNKSIRSRTLGRSRLEFFHRNYVTKVTISAKLEHTLGVRIASPGTTALMLAADPGISGGISNVGTLIIELAEEQPEFACQIPANAPLFPDSATRRLGWLLDTFGDGAPDTLEQYNASLTSQPSFLNPVSARTGNMNAKWHIVVNEEVDLDI